MTVYNHFFAGLDAVWMALLLVSAACQKDARARRACLLGALGVGMVAVNLLVEQPLAHGILRVVAFAVLIWAAYTAISARNREIG